MKDVSVYRNYHLNFFQYNLFMHIYMTFTVHMLTGSTFNLEVKKHLMHQGNFHSIRVQNVFWKLNKEENMKINNNFATLSIVIMALLG